MKDRKKSALFVLFLGVSLVLAQQLHAQAPAVSGSAGKEEQEHGFTLTESFEGSSNSDGYVLDLTSTSGYIFSKHFSLDVGLPIYFVGGTTAIGQKNSSNTVGDAFTALHFTFKNPALNYGATLTATAPSGSTSGGSSTGHATFDWSNTFSREFGAWSPFATIGAGNSVLSSREYKRPYLTLGKVAHFEVGTSHELGHSLSFNASAYAIEPWGTQTLYSRIVTTKAGGAGGTAKSGRVYTTIVRTTGGAELVRDNGFNTGLDFSPSRFVDLGMVFSRSTHLHLNTISFGISFNLSPLFHGAGR